MASGGACTAYYEHKTPPKTRKKLDKMWKNGEFTDEVCRELHYRHNFKDGYRQEFKRIK